MRPSIQHLLDGLTGAAAFVHNPRLDNLAANQLGYALYSDMFSTATGPGPVNSARYVFLDPGARDFYVDWDRAASDVVAVLRSAAGRDPCDRDLSDLVGELSTQSAEFRTRWAAHNVRFHDTGMKELHHPVVGDITLTYKSSGYVDVGGLEMYYELHGHGAPLLLLHGAFGTIESCFAGLLPVLAERYQVIAVELQGHGRTGDVDRPLT